MRARRSALSAWQSRACKAISLIGNFATGDYEYTEQQVDAMFAAMQEALDTARAKYRKGKESKFRFLR